MVALPLTDVTDLHENPKDKQKEALLEINSRVISFFAVAAVVVVVVDVDDVDDTKQ